MNQRLKKVAEEIRRVLSTLLQQGNVHCRELEKYPLSITEVHMSPDLKIAKVYIYPLGGKNQATLLTLLEEERKYLQQELSRKLYLKFTPQLRFYLDNSFDQAKEIHRLLNQPSVQRDLKHGQPPEDE